MNKLKNNLIINAIFILALMINISCKVNPTHFKLKYSNIVKEDSNFVLNGFIRGLKMQNDSTLYFVNNTKEICILNTNGKIKTIIKKINFNYDSLINIFKSYNKSEFLPFDKMKKEGNFLRGIYSFEDVKIDDLGNIYVGTIVVGGENKMFDYEGKTELATFMKYLGMVCKFNKNDNYKSVKLFPIDLNGCYPCFEDGIHFKNENLYCTYYCGNEKIDPIGKYKILKLKLESEHYTLDKKIDADTFNVKQKSDKIFFYENSGDILIAYSNEIKNDKGESLYKLKDTSSIINYFNITKNNKILISIKQNDKTKIYVTTLENLKIEKLGNPITISNIENITNFENTFINLYKTGENYKIDVYEIN